MISYLSNRKFKLILQESSSKEYLIVAGVPQGSILGPILFLFYINDFPTYKDTMIAFFADDTAIISQSWKKQQAVKYIQKHVEILEKY